MDNGEWVQGHYLSIGEKAYIICKAETSGMEEKTQIYMLRSGMR